jgi:hypothetical protein
MLDFYLFRIRVFFGTQMELFREKDPERPQLIRSIVESAPFFELKKNISWHIANVEKIGDSDLYFRIGRISKSNIERFVSGKFIDEQFETAPYTHVLIDPALGVCAIAKKTKLSNQPTGIARQLARILNSSAIAEEVSATLEVDELKDPENFISHLENAVMISKFVFTFKGPNPFDADDFVKPAQNYAKAAKAKKGRNEIEGDSLDSDTLIRVTRSSASTGDEAIAWLKFENKGRKIKKSLKGNPVVIKHDDIQNIGDLSTVLSLSRVQYNRVRNPKGNHE